MAIQILPLLLIGAGAVALATRKKMGIPIGEREGRWLKVYPDTGAFDLKKWDEDLPNWKIRDHEMLARAIWMKAANTIRTGDVIEVVPAPEKIEEWSFFEKPRWASAGYCMGPEFPARYAPVSTAWYVVSRSPADRSKGKKIVNGREVILEAKLIMGYGPKVWRIYERNGPKDVSEPRDGNLATRLLPVMGDIEAWNEEWERLRDRVYVPGGPLMFPEVITIGRNKKTIFSQNHYRKNGNLVIGFEPYGPAGNC